MRFTYVVAPALLFTLAACGGASTSSDAVQTAFRTPAADGFISSSLTDDSSFKREDTDGTGYAYVIGLSRGDSVYTGYSGLINPGRIAPATGGGTATFTGQASGIFVDRAFANSSFGLVEDFSTPIQLTANLSTGQISGGTISSGFPSGFGKTLTFSGTAANGDITGNVTMSGFNGFNNTTASGRMEGRLGDSKAIGAIRGDNGEDLFVGGFSVTR